MKPTQPSAVPPAGFDSLHWQSVRLHLRSHRNIGDGTPIMKILQATLSNVPAGEMTDSQQPSVRRAFHIPGEAAHKIKLRTDEEFALDILFFGGAEHTPVEWLQAFSRYLTTASKANFGLVEVVAIKHHQGEEFLLPEPIGLAHAELEFLSPFPFKRPAGAERTGLDLDGFLGALRQRVKSLFGLALGLPDCGKVRLLPWYWHYLELAHPSKSQPGHTQFYNGCVGPVYFTGEVGKILPWLRLAEAIHAGGKVALNPFGYCRLYLPARPCFDRKLGHASHWLAALEKVRHSHDDWTAELAAQQGAPLAPERFCAELAEAIVRTDWEPEPALAFDLPKRDGIRHLEKLGLREMVLHTGLHEWLAEPVDRLLAPAAMGYRRGRSVQKAVAKVREAIDAGCRYAVQADIEDFFPSVDLDRLEAQLDRLLPPADEVLRGLLRKLLRVGYRHEGELCRRQRGLAQGSPLSPLLANLFLEHFDAVLSAHEARMVRYADDFVLLTRSRAQAERLLERARGELAALGLALSAEKTAVRSVEEGFRFLGQPIGGAAADVVANMIAAPVRKTVYVSEPFCFLARNGEALEIRREGRPLAVVPLRRVASILLLEPAVVSSGLAQHCSAFGIPLVISGHGRPAPALITPASRRHFAVAEAQVLHYARLSHTEKLALAKGFAAQKIENYKPLITARYQAGDAELLAALDAALAGIEQSADTRAVRGHEGHAALLVQKALNGFIKPEEFHFTHRAREEPDRMNGLFNFGYHLLFCRLNALLRGAGLNPYLGFLHDGNDDYESLVCDIEELFRAPVDRLLVNLVNLRTIQADDFHDTPKGLRLQPLAVRRFLQHYEAMLHGDAGGITLAQAMEAQIEAFRRYVVEGQPLWFFQYKAANHFPPTADEAGDAP